VRAPGRIRASAVDPTAPPGHPHRPRHNTCGASINPQGSQIQMETTRSMSARFPKLLLACVAALLAATNATPTHTTPACPHAGLHDMYVTPSARLGFMLDCAETRSWPRRATADALLTNLKRPAGHTLVLPPMSRTSTSEERASTAQRICGELLKRWSVTRTARVHRAIMCSHTVCCHH